MFRGRSTPAIWVSGFILPEFSFGIQDMDGLMRYLIWIAPAPKFFRCGVNQIFPKVACSALTNSWGTWRIIPVVHWAMAKKPPKDRGVPLPNGLSTAYKWGRLTTETSSWDNPPFPSKGQVGCTWLPLVGVEAPELVAMLGFKEIPKNPQS